MTQKRILAVKKDQKDHSILLLPLQKMQPPLFILYHPVMAPVLSRPSPSIVEIIIIIIIIIIAVVRVIVILIRLLFTFKGEMIMIIVKIIIIIQK